MGGYGSGRWGWHRKKTQVEECFRWRIFGMKNYLIPGTWGKTRWMVGEKETGSISFRVLGDDLPVALQVYYTIGKRRGNPEDFDYRINLAKTALYWGGVRYWFLCPAIGCQRRVGCLYLPPCGKYFACRHCYHLSYESRQNGYSEKRFLGMLAAEMQGAYPGINWKDVRDIMDHKHPTHLARIAAERFLAEWEDFDPNEGYLTADELCQGSGLTPETLKELEGVRLLIPDTQGGRYRPKLAGWGKKLAYLLGQGWNLTEIKHWAGGRFKIADPRKWPPERKDWK